MAFGIVLHCVYSQGMVSNNEKNIANHLAIIHYLWVSIECDQSTDQMLDSWSIVGETPHGRFDV